MKNNASLLYSFYLLVGDALAVAAAFTVAYILRVSVNHTRLSAHVSARSYIVTLISLLPFWLLIFSLLGLYNSRVYERRFSELGRLLVGSFIGMLFVVSYSYITNTAIFPARLVVAYGFALAFVITLVFRTVARGIRRELFNFGIGINNVLIVGDTRTTSRLSDGLINTAESGYRIAGVVGGRKHTMSSNHYPLFSSFNDAIKKLGSSQLHTIIQTELYADADQNDEILNYAQQHHMAYRFVPGNSELFVGKIEVDLFHSVPIIAVHQTALIGWGKIVKRAMDIVIGGILLLIASPFMLIIAVIIKLSDGGKVLFQQERLSRYDTKVGIYKFRSHKIAYNGLSPEEAFTKMGRPELIKEYRDHADFIPNDPRISRFGHFMRGTKLDELPQLINVVKGDISLVGPRALVPYELEQSPQKNLILSVKSGLTGLAQISGVADLSFEERRKLDLFYVQNWTFLGDITILLKTFWIVVRKRGTR